ncbi:hypothetical protein E4U21_005482 [Claviceps maximensis]|nr:hypothetical protein E4U21_005482 [Claviceps maximensis]
MQPLRLLRRTLRGTCSSHTKTSSSSPFSVSTHQHLRTRPTRRTVLSRRPATADDPRDPGASSEADGRSCHAASPAPSPPQSPPPPPPPDTSASGPYKQVLLSSSIIAHRGHDGVVKSHLTTRTTPLQTRQLSAADSFFAHNPHKFLYSAESLRHHVPNAHTPEIVILGASNVGKSTFLNALVGSSSAARVSQRPGRTTLMNAFGVGPLPKIPRDVVQKGSHPPRHSLVLVDTPGYGYRSQASWGDAVVRYLEARTMLRGAVVLLSSEKKKLLLPEDKWILRTLAEANTRTTVVLTKADKGRAAWADRCVLMADAVQSELTALHREFGGRWRDFGQDDAAAARIYVTSAGMDTPGKLRNGAGMGGVRMAILEMAGFMLRDAVTKKADTVTYSGPIVSFDDITWRTD